MSRSLYLTSIYKSSFRGHYLCSWEDVMQTSRTDKIRSCGVGTGTRITVHTAMVVQIHVLSTETMELSPTLVVSTDKERYILRLQFAWQASQYLCRFMFNVGDGIQRLCMEHRIRLSKLRHIFLTQLTVKEVGGLPGNNWHTSDQSDRRFVLFRNDPHNIGHLWKRVVEYLWTSNDPKVLARNPSFSIKVVWIWRFLERKFDVCNV